MERFTLSRGENAAIQDPTSHILEAGAKIIASRPVWLWWNAMRKRPANFKRCSMTGLFPKNRKQDTDSPSSDAQQEATDANE